MKLAYVLAGLVLAAVTFWLYQNSRFGVESPPYEVLATDGPFEIREYPSLVLVETPMVSPDVTEGSSFMRLFGYISGSNEADQKISMTTPVMTSQNNGRRLMSFIVPEEVATDGAPEPLAEDVAIGALEGGRFAAYRFGGSWDRAQAEDAATKLGAWIRQRGLDASGSPIVANYDPPFMPPFLRRNEILIRLDS